MCGLVVGSSRAEPRCPPAGLGDDQIDGLLVVELVDLEAAVEHRHVPFRRSTKISLAGFEHRLKQGLLGGSQRWRPITIIGS